MFLPLLVLHSGLNFLLRTTNWADVEFLHSFKVLETRPIGPDTKRVVNPLGYLYLCPSNPDCPKATNVAEETYINSRCIRDCVSVGASNELYHR